MGDSLMVDDRVSPSWLVAWIALGIAIISSPARADDGTTGESIYQSLCATCHGASGEGTADHPERLVGDKSVLELTRLIDESMPKDEPEKCVGEDARKVAAYIYD